MNVLVSFFSTASALRPFFLRTGGGRAIAAALLAGALWGSPAAAQDVRLGFRLGPTFGFLSDSAVPFSGGTPRINANPRIDVHAGAYAIFPLSGHFALQPELLYVGKGGHFSRPLAERYAVERYRLSYLQGLLLGRRALPIRGRLSAHAVAGLSVDVALSGTVQRTTRTAAEGWGAAIDLADAGRLRPWGLGLVVGAGLGYDIGPARRLSLTLRYNPGLRAVFSDAEDAIGSGSPSERFLLSSPLSALRHDVVSATLAYTMSLRRLW
jgi:hypothetical protein